MRVKKGTNLTEKMSSLAFPIFWLSFATLCPLISALMLFKKDGIYEKQRKQE